MVPADDLEADDLEDGPILDLDFEDLDDGGGGGTSTESINIRLDFARLGRSTGEV